VLSSARPVAADQVSDLQAQASQLAAQIQSTGQRISALSQQYDAAQEQIAQLNSQISATQAKITQAKAQVSADQAALREAALNAYVNAGSSNATNPLFSTDQKTTAATQEYNQLAEGNLNIAVADLHTSQNQLNVQQAALQDQEQAQQNAANAAANAQAQAEQQQTQQNAALAQAKGALATAVAEQQAAAAQAAKTAAQAKLTAATTSASALTASSPTFTSLPPPPLAPGSSAAVSAAESYIGVPYVFGGASRAGLDCSGLVMLAWGAAGVSLPHNSAAQMADSTPVPLSALQPGDLLFYGPGGGDHVAMYVGSGEMIEAPFTGASVWITGLRLDSSFVGAGRP
jgi:peptidoglycan DL-endopeptidase CwlO